jgi:hypothetical protein
VRALLAVALLLPTPAAAFCGFFVSGADADLYNDASQVVLMRKGQRTVMSMSNNYKGPPADFAMVIPVPVVLQKGQVKTLKPDVFKKIDQLSAPRLVEYWELDPCAREMDEEGAMMPGAVRMLGASGKGRGGGGGYGVKVEAQFEAGEYQIVILSAKEANGLDRWLRDSGYNIPKGAQEALAPYVASGMKFFVAKVNIKKVKRDAEGTVVLSPLRFDFESKELRLPVRLGLLNAGPAQDLLVYVLSPDSRYEAANYPNVFIPSNLEVKDAVRKSFGAFYAALFDATLEKAGGKAVVTEYSWVSNKCDPCPVPPLQPSDVYTLGGDVLIGGQPGATGQAAGRGGPFFGSGLNWVLTRLHTRYSKETLGEDLVFAPAPAVVGGRAKWNGTAMENPGVVDKAGTNNFQGRYIIRHWWEGEVACEAPRWGRWGGRPGQRDEGGKGKTTPAQNLASAPRGAVKLAEVVTSPLPSLSLPGEKRALRKGEK